jgi:hypothetical protein
VGKTHPGSDIDLAFLLDSVVGRKEYFNIRMKYWAELGGLLRKEIDTIVLNDASDVLLGQVFAKGRVIYGANSGLQDIDAFIRAIVGKFA